MQFMFTRMYTMFEVLVITQSALCKLVMRKDSTLKDLKIPSVTSKTSCSDSLCSSCGFYL